MAEHGLSMVHTTITRWLHDMLRGFERWWNQFAQSGVRNGSTRPT
jgi:transposase-like protein